MLVPLPIPLQLFGIAGVQAPEDNGFTISGNKVTPFNAYLAQLGNGLWREQGGTETKEDDLVHDSAFLRETSVASAPPGVCRQKTRQSSGDPGLAKARIFRTTARLVRQGAKERGL